ncbi:MAG TPA: hypothetical protein VFO58_13935 [Vicinamibacterales bacterium]|nr:hypothetical protein [Vicinamibacterales bacterium]
MKKAVDGGRTFYYVRGLNGQMLTEWDNTGGSATVKDYVYAGSRPIAVVTVDLPSK